MKFASIRLRVSAISRSLLSSTLFDLETRFARIRGLEDLVQLLQCAPFRLHKEKVDKGEFKAVPEHEEDVEPVPNLQPLLATKTTSGPRNE